MNISPAYYFISLTIIFFSSYYGTLFYRTVAIKKRIVANPNFRTLHENPIPRGGGIIFSTVFVISLFLLGFFDIIKSDLLMALGFGGCAAACFGFVDDVSDIRASVKFFIQVCLASWLLFCFDGGPLMAIEFLPKLLSFFVSCGLLVWLMNLYNFMDGVDGMAVSGGVFISLALLVGLVLSGESYSLIVLFSFLAVSCFGFLLLNWPPAKIFMGDSGSIFLGYCFGALIIHTTMTGNISFWTWLIVFGYFLGDTTMTTIMRILIVKKRWYHAHRSHAYQNLARVLGSHLKVTGGVVFYHIVWLLPLSIWSNFQPVMAPLAALFALLPAVIWSFKFGPRLSSA
jgi:Fuc2NAc and GlcNAc transferase